MSAKCRFIVAKYLRDSLDWTLTICRHLTKGGLFYHSDFVLIFNSVKKKKNQIFCFVLNNERALLLFPRAVCAHSGVSTKRSSLAANPPRAKCTKSRLQISVSETELTARQRVKYRIPQACGPMPSPDFVPRRLLLSAPPLRWNGRLPVRCVTRYMSRSDPLRIKTLKAFWPPDYRNIL